MASFPTAVKSFTTKNTGDTIQPADVNDLQDEVNAIEAGYLNGTARLNAGASTLASLVVAGGSTLATLSVTGESTLASLTVTGTMNAVCVGSQSTTFSGVSTRFDNVVVTSSVTAVFLNGNSTAIAISGFSGGRAGRMLYIANTGAVTQVTLLTGSANSSADCRMVFTGGSDKVLPADAATWMVYDGSVSFWRGM